MKRRFYQLLQEYMHRAKVKAADIARLFDVYESHVGNFVKGKSIPPHYDRLIQLAHMLHLSEPEKLELFSVALYERLSPTDKKLYDDIQKMAKTFEIHDRPVKRA